MLYMVMKMYVYYNPNPRGRWYAGDCVIRAVAKATNKTWIEAYMALYVMGMQMGDLANADAVWTAYLKSRGFEREVIPNRCPDCYTVGDFANDNPVGTFVLGTGKHAVTVIDGVIYDTWDSSDEIPIFYMRKINSKYQQT